MYPSKSERDWYAAMGHWWHCIEDLRTFEKKYKTKKAKEKHKAEWIRLCKRIVAARVVK